MNRSDSARKSTNLAVGNGAATTVNNDSRRLWRVVFRLSICLIVLLATGLAVTLALVFHKGTPPTVRTDAIGGARIEAALRQAVATATDVAPQTVRIEEGALNSVLQSRLAPNRQHLGPDESGVIRDLKVEIELDRVHLYVVLGVRGRDMTFDLEGKLRTDNGFLQFDPVAGKIGAVRIPRSALQSAMTQMMATPENREQFRLPSNLSDLRVEDSHLVVTFK